MDFNAVLNSLPGGIVDGLLLGFVYGIAAMGLTLIWGVMRIINLSHGALMALGMFAVYLLLKYLGLNPYISLILIAAAGFLLGFAIYFIAVHRVVSAPHLSSLLATFSVNMILIGLGTAIFTTDQRNVDISLGRADIGEVSIQWSWVVAALFASAVAGLLYLFLYRTRLGKYVRAVANNRTAAELMGIPSSQVLALSFGLGTMLAAIAGGLIATLLSFNILSGETYQTRSFVIVVLGGLGNPLGALIGGLILGVLENIIPIFMDNQWVFVIEFILFVIILLFLPNGLLGRKA